RADDAKAIRAAEVAWNQAWASKDLDKIVSFWADDATIMIPEMPAIKGNAAAKTGLKDMVADPNTSLKFEAATVEVAKSGDYGYTRGNYTLTTTDAKTKKVVMEKGKFLTIYKKQADGTWKAVEDINNSDAPAAPIDAKK